MKNNMGSINTNDISIINNDFKGIYSDMESIWQSSYGNIVVSSLNEFVGDLELIKSDLDTFNTAYDKLQKYIENDNTIADLETKIANEKSNPSVPYTYTYTKDGKTVSETRYKVNQTLIDGFQIQIDTLTEENLLLKEEIIGLLDSIHEIYIQPKNNNNIAHRGYRRGGVTDNSIEAFRAAGENGFWGCEVDVIFDANGNLVCSHNAPKDNENPPSFDDYLAICKEYGMTAIIDMKYGSMYGKVDPNLSPAILEAVERAGMIDSCVFQTNNTKDIPFIRETSSEARIWYLTNSTSADTLRIIEENGVECVNLQSGDGVGSSVKRLTDAGIDTCVWAVQTPESRNYYERCGATYIMTDNLLDSTPYQEGEENFNEEAYGNRD